MEGGHAIEQAGHLEQSARALFEHSPDFVWWMDTKGTIISVNTRAQEVTGFLKRDFVSHRFDHFIAGPDIDKTADCFKQATKGKPQNFESLFRHNKGHEVPLHITFVPVTVDYRIVGVYGIAKDITEIREYEATLKQSNDFITSMLESITDGFLTVDEDWQIAYVNKGIEGMTRSRWEDCTGTLLWNTLPQLIESTSFFHLCKALNEQISVQYEFYYRTSDKWYSVNAYPYNRGILIYISDITRRKKADQRLAQMDYYDSVTGLPIRQLFTAQIDQFSASGRENKEIFSVMFVDLALFTIINHLTGYSFADRILAAASKRIASIIRENDILTRYEGDIFAVLLPQLDSGQAAAIRQAIMEAFRTPFTIDTKEFMITPYFGISSYPEDGSGAERLLESADAAVRKDRDAAEFRQHGEEKDNTNLRSMGEELKGALERNEMSVVYQPQVNVRSGEITGVEALLRWKHPQLGGVSPGEFIPVAEETGLIVPIGAWVLRTACEQLKMWQDAGVKPMAVSVNLSPLQFIKDNIVETVKEVLERTGLDPKYLDLEITEGMTMDVNHVLAALHELKALGIRISMDDFGKGYSSLSYLKQLPLDTLKIDQSFVHDCTIDESDAMIVRTIISMAHHLNLNVIAEGVETGDHLVFLQQELCDEAQGYLFSRPLPPEELLDKLPMINAAVKQYGMDIERTEQMWIEDQLRIARQDLINTVRKQQGLTFKIKEEKGRFIHTLCDGELLHRFQLTPEQVVGYSVHDILPFDVAEQIHDHFRRAWQGEPEITFENEINGIWFLATLRPIRRGGRVVEVIGNCIDISERKRIENELKATKEELESFFQNTPDAIAMIDLNGNVQKINGSFVQMYGWTNEEIIGQPLPIIPEHLRDEHQCMMNSALSGTMTIGSETVRMRKDGSLVDVSLSISLIKDASGQPVAIAGTLRDISKRKEAELALRESEERYRHLVEVSPDIILVHDQGQILFVNQSGLDFAGVKEFDPTVGKLSIYSFLAPEDVGKSDSRVRLILKGMKLPPDKLKVVRANGDIHYFEVTAAPVLFQGKQVVQAIARDVTERIRNEESLAKMNEQYRLIAENMSDLITVLDADLSITYTSPSHETVLGYPDGYITDDTSYQFTHPDDIELLGNVFLKMKQSGLPQQFDFRYKHHNGEWIVLETKGSSVFSEDGKLDHIILVSRDVTERKKMEGVVRESETLAAVGGLAAEFAHHIRNPITTIRGYIQLIQKGTVKPQYLKAMCSEMKSLEGKVDEILGLVKPQRAGYTLIDAEEILNEVLLDLEDYTRLFKVQITKESECGRLSVNGDRQQLKQVFVNLLTNAMEAMTEGGVIQIQLQRMGTANIRIAINYDGLGISEEDLHRINEPFFRTKGNGFGLGLTISRKIINEHGGTIALQSKGNKGITAEVNLPAHLPQIIENGDHHD